MSSFYVSRQRYYYTGESVVEVTAGGRDYAGPDMLVAKYPGEGEEYRDPREAIEAAIKIASLWRLAAPDLAICVATGATLGMGLELESGTDEEARAWGEKLYASAEKCGCGEIMPEKRSRWHLIDDSDGTEFCSERCAEKEAEFRAEMEAELNSEEVQP